MHMRQATFMMEAPGATMNAEGSIRGGGSSKGGGNNGGGGNNRGRGSSSKGIIIITIQCILISPNGECNYHEL